MDEKRGRKLKIGALLPRVCPGLGIRPIDEPGSRDQSFLVEVGGHCFRVNDFMKVFLEGLLKDVRDPQAMIGHLNERTGRLLTLGEVWQLVEGLPGGVLESDIPTETPPPVVPFLFHWTMLPGRWVAVIAQRLRALLNWPMAILTALGFSLASVYILRHGGPALQASFSFMDLVWTYAILVSLTLWHELGHAAASARFDCPPGSIGAGWYYVWPVFFTDVTRIWRLRAIERATVDVGGIYFQAMGVCALALAAKATGGNAILLRAGVLTLFTMVHTLNPFFKMDGYWLLVDLGGLSNLHGRVWSILGGMLPWGPSRSREILSPRQRALLWGYLALGITYWALIARVLGSILRGYLAKFPQNVIQGWNQFLGALTLGHPLRIGSAFWSLLLASFWPLMLFGVFSLLLKRLARYRRRVSLTTGIVSKYGE